MDAIVDRADTPIPSSSSNTIDGVYGQCGAVVGTVKKTQWRRAAVNTVTLPTLPGGASPFAGCTDLEAVMNVCDTCSFSGLWNCSAFSTCVLGMMDAAGQTDDTYAHIYVVETLGCGWAGLHLQDPASGRKWIAIIDSHGPQSNEFTATTDVAHELAHALGLGHVSDSWANCSATSKLVRNLMCANGGGRLLEDNIDEQQCSDIRSSTAYSDFN